MNVDNSNKTGTQSEARPQMMQQPPTGLPSAMPAVFQQQQQAGQPQQFMGGLPFALMGASPLQQQLSALSGFGVPTAPPTAPPLPTAPPQDPQQTAQLLQTLLASQALQQQQPQASPFAALQQQPQPPQQQQPNHLQQAMLLAMQQQQAPQINPLQQQLQQLMMYQQLLAQQPAMAAALLGAGQPQQQPQAQPMHSATAIPNMVSIPGNDPTMGETKTVEWAEPFSGKTKKEPPFPLKLHQILGNPEFSDCITWNPSGRSWRILKPPVFEQVVIPLYFRHAKYASFMRQVNGWGFKRIVSGHDHNSYYHEQFIRENPQACLAMKRVRKINAEDVVSLKHNKKKPDCEASQITDTSASDNSSEEQQAPSMNPPDDDAKAQEEDAKPPAKEEEVEGNDENDADNGDSTDENTDDQNSTSGDVAEETNNEMPPQAVIAAPQPQNPQNVQLPAALSQPNVLNSLLPGLAATAPPVPNAAPDASAAALGMLGGMGFDASTLQKLHEALQQRQQQPPPQPTGAVETPVLGHTAFLAAQLQQALKGSRDNSGNEAAL